MRVPFEKAACASDIVSSATGNGGAPVLQNPLRSSDTETAMTPIAFSGNEKPGKVASSAVAWPLGDVQNKFAITGGRETNKHTVI